MFQIPDQHVDQFRSAGWSPGRNSYVPNQVPEGHMATEIIATLGGLHVGSVGEGIECASSDIRFRWVPDCGEITMWQSLLKVKLVGIGEADHSHETLWVDDLGRWFGLSEIHPAFYIHGESTREALDSLLLGYRVRPLLAPDQRSVSVYGETYTAGDERLYWEAP